MIEERVSTKENFLELGIRIDMKITIEEDYTLFGDDLMLGVMISLILIIGGID